MQHNPKLSLAYTRKSDKDGLYNTIERDLSRFKDLGFEDHQILYDIQSGNDDDRPQFHHIWTLIKTGQLESLTITRDDRLGRKGQTLLRFYKDMEENKATLIVLDDGGVVDFGNPYEWGRRADSAVRSEYERRMLISRITKGQDFRKQQGKSVGGRAPYGYHRDRKLDILINEHQRDELKKIVQITLEALTLSDAVREVYTQTGLNWSATQLRHWMLCASLRGHTGWKRIRLDLHQPSDSPIYERMQYDTCPNNRIISEEDYRQHLSKMEINKKLWGTHKSKSVYPLRGLCYCKHCGEKLIYSQNGTILQLKHTSVLNNPRLDECRYIVRAKDIEVLVLNSLISFAKRIVDNLFIEPVKETSPEVLDLQRKIQTLELMNDLLLTDAIHALYQQLESLTSIPKEHADQQLKEQFVRVFSSDIFWQTLNDKEKYLWCSKFIDRVVITKHSTEVKTKFV